VLVSPRDEHALAEAIIEVLQNRRLAGELREKGLARASQHGWERTAAETVDVYRSVISE
jgi:glycosyltransferase involved in cell wall biosynthesis